MRKAAARNRSSTHDGQGKFWTYRQAVPCPGSAWGIPSSHSAIFFSACMPAVLSEIASAGDSLTRLRDQIWTSTSNCAYNPPPRRAQFSIILFHERNHAMRSLLVPSAVLLMAATGVAVAAEEIESGLQVGERTSPNSISSAAT